MIDVNVNVQVNKTLDAATVDKAERAIDRRTTQRGPGSAGIGRFIQSSFGFSTVFILLCLLPLIYGAVRNQSLFPTFLIFTVLIFCVNFILHAVWRGLETSKTQLFFFFATSFTIFILAIFLTGFVSPSLFALDDALFGYVVIPMMYAGFYTVNYILFWQMYNLQ